MAYKKNGKRRLQKRNFFDNFKLPEDPTNFLRRYMKQAAVRYIKDKTGDNRLSNMVIDTVAGLPTPRKEPRPDPGGGKGPGPAAVVVPDKTNDVGKGKKRRRPSSSSTKRGRRATVVHGKTGPKFKRARRTKLSKFAKYGMQMQYEYRDSVTDPQCVYLGHGVPIDQLYKTVIYSVVKRLFLDAGIEIENFDAIIQRGATAPTGFRYYVDIYFWDNVGSTDLTRIQYVHDYTQNKESYVDMVDRIVEVIDTALSAGAVLPVFDKFELYIGNSTERYDCLARLPLADCRFTMEFKGKLSIQNVTTASGGEGDSKLSTDRIDINPVKGLKYESINQTNCILPKIRNENTTAAWGAFMVELDSGHFQLGAADLAGTFSTFKNGMNSGYYKPPNPRSFHAVKCTSARIEPGEIRMNYLKWGTSLKFQRFMELIHDQVVNRAGTSFVKLGKVAMFAFEHALCQATESPIKLDYQCDWTLGCRLYYRKVASVPMVRVEA